jgi:hypothetical protein
MWKGEEKKKDLPWSSIDENTEEAATRQYRNRARQKPKRPRRERSREGSEGGGVDITRYYRSISVSKMLKKRKLTVAVIDTGSNVEIGIKYRVQCVKGGRGGKEGRERIDNGGIDIARYYQSISGSKMQKTITHRRSHRPIRSRYAEIRKCHREGYRDRNRAENSICYSRKRGKGRMGT